jgi:hypothetical protein
VSEVPQRSEHECSAKKREDRVLPNVIVFTEKKWPELLTLRFNYDKLGQDAKAGHKDGGFHLRNVSEDSSKRADSRKGPLQKGAKHGKV